MARNLLYKTYYLIHLTTLLRGLEASAAEGFFTCTEHFTILRLRCLPFRKKYHIVAGPRPAQIATKRPHPALRSISPNRVSKLFTCNKSNTTCAAVLLSVLQYNQCSKGGIQTLTMREKMGYFGAGLNGHQHRVRSLHAEAFASLCAACRQYGATAFCRHTCTKTVALRTLTSVRLIGALHFTIPSWFKSNFQSIYRRRIKSSCLRR